MKIIFFLLGLVPFFCAGQAATNWQNADSVFGALPKSVHVYFTNQKIDTAPFKAYYVIADLKDKSLDFTTDTSLNRRLRPSDFFKKNNFPLLVVNGTFFSFETNRNLNLVIQNGKLLSYNQQTIPGRKKDTLTYSHPFSSAIGISKRREADIAWTLTDSAEKFAYVSQVPIAPLKDSVSSHPLQYFLSATRLNHNSSVAGLKKWKMKTAIGGGPVLIQNNQIAISNNEEMKFGGKAVNDKHPRTAIGYTAEQKLIILVVEGRNKEAGGASLLQLAQLMKELGCIEALNLDGGGSSCLLINGKETIKPSDPSGQRPIPAIFMILNKD
ncbi:MAG TPA: phosphodiester glycosidase family protein [Flavisolibacter sp.]